MRKDSMVVVIKKSKTDQRGESCQINISQTHTKCCPHLAMQRYLGQVTRSARKPLFLFESGTALTARALRLVLHHLIRRCGYSTKLYNTHSLRIGAATAAARPATIKNLGRWRSEAYKVYTHHPLTQPSDSAVIASAQKHLHTHYGTSGNGTKTCKTVDDVQQFIGKEQFLETLSNPEQKLWAMEKKPKTSIAAGEQADEYEQARQPGLQKTRHVHQVGQQKTMPIQRQDANIAACLVTRKRCVARRQARAKEVQKRQDQGASTARSRGMYLGNALKKALMCFKDSDITQSGPWVVGLVEGWKVSRILLDTGCTRTMVRQQRVPPENIIDGKIVSIRCARGDTKLYNLADLTLRVRGVPVKVEAAVTERYQ